MKREGLPSFQQLRNEELKETERKQFERNDVVAAGEAEILNKYVPMSDYSFSKEEQTQREASSIDHRIESLDNAGKTFLEARARAQEVIQQLAKIAESNNSRLLPEAIFETVNNAVKSSDGIRAEDILIHIRPDGEMPVDWHVEDGKPFPYIRSLENSLEVAERASSLAIDLHEAWRESRLQKNGEYAPRAKKTTDEAWIATHGTDEVDIANNNFGELPRDWQEENRQSATSASVSLEQRIDKIYTDELFLKFLPHTEAKTTDAMSEDVHDAWRSRILEKWIDESDPTWSWAVPLMKEYEQLPEDEKEKDRVVARRAMYALKKSIDRNKENRDSVSVKRLFETLSENSKKAAEQRISSIEREVALDQARREAKKKEGLIGYLLKVLKGEDPGIDFLHGQALPGGNA